MKPNVSAYKCNSFVKVLFVDISVNNTEKFRVDFLIIGRNIY